MTYIFPNGNYRIFGISLKSNLARPREKWIGGGTLYFILILRIIIIIIMHEEDLYGRLIYVYTSTETDVIQRLYFCIMSLGVAPPSSSLSQRVFSNVIEFVSKVSSHGRMNGGNREVAETTRFRYKSFETILW